MKEAVKIDVRARREIHIHTNTHCRDKGTGTKKIDKIELKIQKK